MESAEPTRKEIEAKLAVSGDYVKMDFLQRCLKKRLDFDTRRFVILKLSAIYESRKMFLEAGRLTRNVADINTTFDGKYTDFARSMVLYIKAGEFDEADLSFKKAIACGNEKQKSALKTTMKEAFLSRAKEMLSKDKRKSAADVYEQMLTLAFLDFAERKEIQNSLMNLYQKLGKIREFYAIQKEANNPQPVKFQPEERQKYDSFNASDLIE